MLCFSRLSRHAHGLACIQAFAHWLELLNLESKRQNNDSAEEVKSMVITILEGTLPLLQSTVCFLLVKFRYFLGEKLNIKKGHQSVLLLAPHGTC